MVYTKRDYSTVLHSWQELPRFLTEMQIFERRLIQRHVIKILHLSQELWQIFDYSYLLHVCTIDLVVELSKLAVVS